MGKTVFMPRCSSAQRSVASAWREKRTQVVSRVRGVCDDVTCLLTSEMVVPRNLNDSTTATVVVHDGEWGECRGVSPEVHYHRYSFERVKLQVVVTAPDSKLLNLLSVSRLVSILDETNDCGVICKLQEFDRGVFRGAVICVEGE